MYTALHCHSYYSLLDGHSSPERLAQRCEEIGIKSCAITDHGNISGVVHFYEAMKQKKIKPILGCELYICDDDPTIRDKDNKSLSHFIVLAKNLQGYKDLISAVSASNKPENFYHKPRLDLKTLAKYGSGNWIIITGHLGSTLSDTIIHEYNLLKDDYLNMGVNHVLMLKKLFGDNVFLEVQLFDKEHLKVQEILTKAVREIAQKTNTKTIATPDAHYAFQRDAVDQRILLCNNLKMNFVEVQRKLANDEDVPLACFFKSDKYYIPSPEELKELHLEEELANTLYVDSLIEEYDILSRPKLPEFKTPDKSTPDEYLRQLCRVGFKNKIVGIIDKEKQQEYVDRVKMELEVLQGAGLSSYFLIIHDILDYIRKRGWLPGPGRGSAAGCLVSYLIGITSIDPIKYNLLFERFYNSGRNTANRVSMPDIDVDVPIDKREEVIKYIKDRYGHDNVSQMITFNTMKGRSALKDVLRSQGNISFEEMNQITKFIPDEAKIADELAEMKEETGEASIIRWALENNSKQLKDWCFIDDDGNLQGPLAKSFEQAIRLEGTKINQSKHAAGICICDEPLHEICPMIYDSKNSKPIAGMEMQRLESIGIIKFDILGIALLDKIMCVQDLLGEVSI